MALRNNMGSGLWAIACGQFSLALMNVLFMFYYVKVFLNYFHVSTAWFTVAQILFAIWNAVNDPLFGYVQDSPGLWLSSRSAVIRRFSPFLGLGFIVLWFPWNSDGTSPVLEGIHVIFALFLYDAFFSAVGVAVAALFADFSKDPAQRVAALKYSQSAILLAVTSIGIVEKLSASLENFVSFQVCMTTAAVLAIVSLRFCASLVPPSNFNAHKLEDEEFLLQRDDAPENSTIFDQSLWKRAFHQSKEVLSQPNFLAVIITSFIHTARSVSHLNFASISTEILIPQDVLPSGSLQLSVFYGVCTLFPQIALILSERLVMAVGARKCAIISFLSSTLVPPLYFVLFGATPFATMIFMLADSVAVHSIAPLFNVFLSDCIDADAALFRRKAPISTTIFALHALVMKPAQSVAPIVVTLLMNGAGYQDYLSQQKLAHRQPSSELYTRMQFILYATPVVCGFAQLLIFRHFNLSNARSEQNRERQLKEVTV